MNLLDLYCRIAIDHGDYDRGLDDARDKSINFGDMTKDVFKKMAKAATVAFAAAEAAIGAFAKSSIDAGMQFDAAMSQVAAVSGATGEEFDALRQKAMEMGASTKFSATESAEAFNYMAMAGWKTKDMLNGISGIMDLVAAAGENLGAVSDIVTDALTAFGLAAEDSGHFADILAAASSNANTNVSMMGETFKYAAPVAGAFGYTAEDTALAIGLMANSGIKASQAGTSLRAILTQMSGPISIAENGIQKTAVATENADGSMRSFRDVLVDLRGEFANMTESEKAWNAENIAGKNAMSGFLALMNASQADFDKLAGSIDNCTGAAKNMADTMIDNLAGDITLFKSALEGAQIVISNQLTPSLREFVQFGSEAVSKLSTAFQDGGLSSAMEVLGTILGDGLNMVVSALPSMIEAGAQLLQAIITGVIQTIPQLQATASELFTSFVSYLQENLPQLISSGLQALLSFSKGLRENIGSLVDAAIELVMTLADGIIEALPDLIATVPEIISNLADAINDNAPKLLLAAAELIAKLAQGLIENIPVIIANAPKIALAIFDVITAFNWINLGAKIVTGIINGVKSMFGSVVTTAQTLVQNWRVVISDLPGYFQAIGKDMIQGLINGIKSMAGTVVENIKSIGTSAVSGLKSILGIHSPSTVFAGIGGNMALGLVEGWDDEISNVRDRITKDMNFGTANVDFASSAVGQSSAAIINSVSGGEAGNVPVIPLTINLLTGDARPFAEWILPDLIKVASANGTPIAGQQYA